MTDLDQILDAITELSRKVDRVEVKLDSVETILSNYVKATGEDLDRVRTRLDKLDRPLTNGFHV